MVTFAYTARDTAGRRVSGTVAAASEQAVLVELAGRELAPLELRPLRRLPRLRRRVSVRALATSYRQLADLLRVGMPLLKALELLSRGKANARLSAVWTDVAERIVEGGRLADAMGRHADAFPPIQVAMIRAGERGGCLEQVLARLGGFIEHQADLRSKVMGALIYPFVLLVVGAAVVVWALVFQVPKFAALFARIEMPLQTRILLGASDVIVNHWFVVALCLAAVVAAALWARRRPEVRIAVARAQLAIPRLGPLLSSLAIARFCRILGTLLTNGVPMLQSMEISRDAIGHPLLAAAIDQASDAVRAGESLARPLGDSHLFPDDVAEMISVGESANNLDEVLLTIAETIEKRVDRMLNLFVRLMEPALLLCLAGVVLFIFMALVVPMLRLSSSV